MYSLAVDCARLATAAERIALALAPQPFTVAWSVGPATLSKEDPLTMPLALTMLDNMKDHVAANPLDAGSEDAKSQFPAGLIWASDNPTVAGLEVDPDGFGAWVLSNDIGTASITVTGTATDGTVLSDVIVVEIQASQPASLNLTASVPVSDAP